MLEDVEHKKLISELYECKSLTKLSISHTDLISDEWIKLFEHIKNQELIHSNIKETPSPRLVGIEL